MNNNSGFGDINNCNSLNSSVVSSPTVNSISRNSFYKLTNVLLLLFLVFGSSVMSFGSMENENQNTFKTPINNTDQSNVNPNNNNMDIINTNINKCADQLSLGTRLLLSFATGLITGIGGYDNKWKPLNENWGLHWFMSNLWLAYGLNKRIYENKYIDVDLHIVGINLLSILESIIIQCIHNEINPAMSSKYLSSKYFLKKFKKTWQEKIAIIITNFCDFLFTGAAQFLDVEIKVFKYWSISLNLLVHYTLFKSGR